MPTKHYFNHFIISELHFNKSLNSLQKQFYLFLKERIICLEKILALYMYIIGGYILIKLFSTYGIIGKPK